MKTSAINTVPAESGAGGRVIFSEHAREKLAHELRGYFAHVPSPRVLEAGCGSGSNIEFPKGTHVTGIDISQEELDKNTIVDEKIVGDIQSYPLAAESYDLVVCWDVLEHLDEPQKAMKNMAGSVAQGGLLLLAFPNVRSVKAAVAKFTPHWVHVALNNWIYGARAGSPGLINFPTYLRWSISPSRMAPFARDNGLSIDLRQFHESGVQRRFYKKVHVGPKGVALLDGAVRMLTLGGFTLRGSDCIFLFRKTAVSSMEAGDPGIASSKPSGSGQDRGSLSRRGER